MQSIRFGLLYVAGAVGVMGHLAFSLGIAARFPRSFYKFAALFVTAYTAVGLVGIFATEHVHNINIELFFESSKYFPIVTAIWLVILGVGMFKGMSGLTPDSPPSQDS